MRFQSNRESTVGIVEVRACLGFACVFVIGSNLRCAPVEWQRGSAVYYGL